jgi:diguanylate cyclase (GGDEF)-like protein
MFHDISTGGEPGLDRPRSAPRQGRYDDLWQLALADPNTGLVNQVLLLDRLTQALKRSRRHGGYVLVCHIDLTNFGEIYDRLGYISANEVLAEVCRRLTSLLRSEDTLGRVGRSEIVAVMAIDGEQATAVMAGRLTSALEQPVAVVGHEVHVTSSFGVVVAEDGESAENLMVRADGAADCGSSFTERYMHHHG